MFCIQVATMKETGSDIRSITNFCQDLGHSCCGQQILVLRAAHPRYNVLSVTYSITLQRV
ncbi:hypothetical protein WI27_27140 [Burkholderia cepacia]|nr:hypothetical protein WI27_27140 [Burkholderia cepacia]